MKASAAQVGAALDRVAAGTGDTRIFLFHGPDEAGALAFSERLHRAMGSDVERIDLDGATLKSRPGALADEAASLSLFGGRRFIRITPMGEESLEAVELLLEAATAGNPVVAIAPNVKASGKLVKLGLASPGAVTHACYIPEGPEAARLATGIAREHGVRLTGDTAAAMVEAAGGDRAVLTREIEKLSLYLDAAPERPRDADAVVLTAIGANLVETEMSDAIAAVIDGNPAALGPELAAIDNAGTAIPLLRALERRLIALADMRGEVDDGASADSVVERHRVFWKEKASTIKALRHWSSPQIAAGLERVRRAERALMAGGGAVSASAMYDTLGLARAAARR